MIRIFVFIGLSFLLALTASGCSSEKGDIERVIMSRLKDPDSVKFYELNITERKTRACIVFNAKNSLGGYGERHLASLSKQNGIWVIDESDANRNRCSQEHFNAIDDFEDMRDEFRDYISHSANAEDLSAYIKSLDELSDGWYIDTESLREVTKLGKRLLANPGAIPTTSKGADEAAYQAATQALIDGRYEEAVAMFSAFTQQYPQSSHLPEAYYWQGEASYVLRNFGVAIVAFQTVIDKFPVSMFVAEAMLKKGFCQYELGELNEAVTTLNIVLKEYSNTKAARLAKVRLDRMTL